AITSDLRVWGERRKTTPPMILGAATPGGPAEALADVAPLRMRLVLAGLLLDAGEHARAESLCRELLPYAAVNGDLHALLGTIAFYRDDRAGARTHWARDLQLGVSDDALCYRYAILAQNSGAPAGEIRPLLDRAVAIRPAFDDARYSL